MILTQQVAGDAEVRAVRAKEPTVAVYFGGVWSTLYLSPDEARALAASLVAAADQFAAVAS